MALREFIDSHRVAATVGAITLVVVVGIFLVLRMGRSNRPPTQEYAYFTVDDGATYFQDEAKKVAPFDHDGKPAVLAHVFTTDDGKTKVVGYLERVNPEMKDQFENAKASGELNEMMAQEAIEVKKPGEGKWVKMQAELARPDITDPKRLGSEANPAKEVFPGR